MHGPTTIVLPYFFNSTDDAGIAIPTMRKIPYQITKAGDVLLDLTLANDYLRLFLCLNYKKFLFL